MFLCALFSARILCLEPTCPGWDESVISTQVLKTGVHCWTKKRQQGCRQHTRQRHRDYGPNFPHPSSVSTSFGDWRLPSFTDFAEGRLAPDLKHFGCFNQLEIATSMKITRLHSHTKHLPVVLQTFSRQFSTATWARTPTELWRATSHPERSGS